MSSRAAVSSEITIAKKITVTAMYQEVAIQLTTSGLSINGDGADGVADIDQEQQQQQRHENQPHPQARRKEDDGGDKCHQFVGARFDEDDRARCADQPHQRALQRQHAWRSRLPLKGSLRLSPHSHHTLATYATSIRQRLVPAIDFLADASLRRFVGDQ